MNKFFRVIWSKTRQCMTVVPEVGRIGAGRTSARRSRRQREAGASGAGTWASASVLFAAFVAAGLADRAYAEPGAMVLPQNGRVSAGQANIRNGAPGAMVIDQGSNRAIINWDSFNIGRDASVEFRQPSSGSVALNRVDGVGASEIHGRLSANGQVWVSNRRGVYFGKNAQVDVGGLVATAHSIKDDEFMAGGNRFSRNGADGAVVNDGRLTAGEGGYIALLAPEVRNRGVIVARRGTVALAAGEVIDLEFDEGGSLMNLRVEAGEIETLVENGHLIEADGGQVIMTAGAANAIRSGVVRNSGTVNARGISQSGGRIFLGGGKVTTTAKSRLRASVALPEKLTLSSSSRPVARPERAQIHIDAAEAVLGGSLDASGPRGGTIAVEGNHITLTDSARLNATGQAGGGNVLVGGDWQGGTNPERRVFESPDAMRQAQSVTMAGGARIDASAIGQGDGGRVVLWSDVGDAASVTRVAGEIRADAGALAGDGGGIETSGHSLFTAGATGSASAAAGKAGEWLFDPTNITVTNSATTGGGVAGATVTSGEIARLLNDGTSVTLLADVDLTWNSNAVVSVAPANPVTLSLLSKGTAASSLTFGSGAKIESTGAPLNVDIRMRTQFGYAFGTVNLSGLTALTNGGDFGVVNAVHYDPGTALYLGPDTLIDTGSGNISLSGYTNNTGGADGRNFPILIEGATLTTTDGDITIAGDLSGTNAVVWTGSQAVRIVGGADISTTGSGDISISGVTSNGNAESVYLVIIDGNTRISSGGALDISAARTVGSGRALQTGDAALSATGDVTITASESNAYTWTYSIGDTNISSSSGNVAIAVNGSQFNMEGAATISTGAGGDLTLRADGFYRASAGYTLTADVGGDLTVEPYSTSFPSAFTLNGTMSGNTFTASGSLAGLVVTDFPAVQSFTLGKAGNLANMTLAGNLSLPGTVTVYGGGIDISGDLTSFGDGDILLRSTSGANGAFHLRPAASIVKSGGEGTLTMKGDARILSEGAISTANGGILNVILWSDFDNDNNDGGVSQMGTISTGGGHVWMGGSNSVGGTSTWNGLTVGDGPSIRSTGYNGNWMDFYGDITTGGGDLLAWAGGTGMTTDPDGAIVNVGSGDVTFIADSITGGGFQSVMVSSTGHLTLAPDGGAYSSTLDWTHNNTYAALNFGGLLNYLLVNDFDQLTGLTIGRYDGMSGVAIGNSSNVTMVDGAELAGPISVYGGDIDVNADLTATAANAGVLLKGAGNVNLNQNASITTNGGHVRLWANDDGQISIGSVGLRKNSSITTGGGNLWAGGGSGTTTWNGLTVGDGYAVAGTIYTPSDGGSNLIAGFYLEHASVDTGGGDILMRGKSTTDLSFVTYGNVSLDAGAGKIALEGVSSAISNGAYIGLHSSVAPAHFTATSTNSAADAISINVSAPSATGYALGMTGHVRLQAPNGGGISVVSKAASGAPGVRLGFSTTNDADVRLLADSGPINFDTGTSALALVNTISSLTFGADGTIVGASSSDVTLTADNVNLASAKASDALMFATAGAITYAPASASFSAAQDIGAKWVFGTAATGVTFGKAGNTANLTISNPLTANGPITAYGSAIAIDSALTATRSRISLIASGAVTQSAALTASELLLGGTGSFTLTDAGNAIGTIAGGSSTTRLGALSFTNAGALSIGTVGSSNGITASGDVLVETLAGNLTLAEAVGTTSTSADAVLLNAGRSAAAGTASGGNIIVSGSPSVTSGTGGTIRLMSGSVAGSTGLTALVGSGSGRFRYNSDEAVQNYTTALATGVVNAIYRETITLAGVIADKAVTYGDAVPSFNFGSGGTVVNGDDMFAILSPQNSGAGLLRAGSYGISAADFADLGYTLGSITNGTLTVAKKALTISGLSGQSKVYDGTTTAVVSGMASLQATVAPGAGSGTDGKAHTGDTVSLNGTATGAFNSKNVTAADRVAFTGLSLNGADAANYTLTPHAADTAARITAKSVTLSASKTYDGSAALGGAVSIGGLVGSEMLTYSGATASNAHVAASGKYIAAITLADGANGGLASNYRLPALNAANAPVTILARTLTASLTNTGVTKTYDGTTQAPTGFVPGYSFAGLVSGDSSASLGATGIAYNSANVASANLLTVSGLSITGITGTNGSQVTDYVLDATAKSTAATITPAALTVRANSDAKFVTQSDAAGYAGVSYSGFVNGETRATASGLIDPGVSRTSRGPDGNPTGANNLAGTYTGQLIASGGSADNYSFSYQNGDYAIVPSDQLLVRVMNVSDIYGIAANYQITRVEYFDGSQIVRLDDGSVAGSGVLVDAGNQVTVNDGAGGSAKFGVGAKNAVLSGSSNLAVGVYQLGSSGQVTENSQNFSDKVTVVGMHEVLAKAVTASTSGGVSKVYDGSTAMTGVSLQLAGLTSGDTVLVDGAGAFGDRNAGSNKSYTISNLALNGQDAGNYYLTGAGSFTGTNGVITPKILTAGFTASDKVYDGNRIAAVTGSSTDIVSGDQIGFNAGSALFADKNVGTGKSVAISGIVLTGADAGNYALSGTTAATTASITRLDEVTWIGGASGDWFDPANWAGGAVPDLSNVANVVIPEGVDVTFGSNVVAPAEAGPVNVDSIGSDGSLTQTAGELNVGDGGIRLAGFSQSGGTTGSSGDVTVGDFDQSGGSFATSGGSDLTVTRNFSQSGGGSVTVSGNAGITDTAGGATLGNLSVGGNLDLSSTDGPITQTGGSAITVAGETTLGAEKDGAPADITLDGPGNDFGGVVNASGGDISLADRNKLALGRVIAGGGLAAKAGGTLELTGPVDADRVVLTSDTGDVLQTGGSLTTRTGPNTVTAPGSVALTQPGNSIDGGLVVDSPNSSVSGNTEGAASEDVRREMAAWQDAVESFTPDLTAQAIPQPIAMNGITRPGTVTRAVQVRLTEGFGVGRSARVAVTIDRELLGGGSGFSFALPAELANSVARNGTPRVGLAGGRPLPEWLVFDPARGVFEVDGMPPGALPIVIVIAVDEGEIEIEVSEQN